MISDLDLEKSIIGTVIMSAESLVEVGPILKPDFFSSPRHKIIWQAIQQIELDKVDRLAIGNKLKEQGQLETVGGHDYLKELIQNGEMSTKIINRAESLIRMAWTNQAEVFFEKFLKQITSQDKPINEIMESAQSEMSDLLQFGIQSDIKPLGEIAEKIYEYLMKQSALPKDQRETGISSGYKSLDNALGGGFKKGDLVVLAGRPAMGKSVVAKNIAFNCDVPVLFFAIEMTAEQIAERILAGESKVSLTTIRGINFTNDKDERLEKISEKVKRIKNKPFYIVDAANMTPLKIKAITRNAVRKYGVQIVFVDYIQIVKTGLGKGDDKYFSREQEINYIVTSLKELAMELKIPIVAMAQVGRQVESRQDKRPNLSDLRESGSIENNADIVVFIYRDEVYHEKTKEKDTIELIFAKFRNGDSGALVKLKFFKEFQKIVEILKNA